MPRPRLLRTPYIIAGMLLMSDPSRIVAQSANISIAFTIDATTTYQTIDGFGGFQGGNHDSGNPNSDFSHLIVDLPEPTRTQVLDRLFSDWNGIGLTILRMRIPPEMEEDPGHWNYVDNGSCYLADGLTSTNVACDTFTSCPPGQTCQNTQVWLMKQATKRGPLKLFSSVFSPPGWMKSNLSTQGGYLLPAHYQDYADFLSHYANEYAAANGLHFYVVSMQNEPDAPGPGACGANLWDTCAWDDSTIATFLKQNLAPTFLANHVTAKVMAPEAGKWDFVEASAPFDPLGAPTSCPPPRLQWPLMHATYGDPAALARVDIVAGHTYSGSNVALRFDTALTAGKTVWQTETSQLGNPQAAAPGGTNLWDINGSLEWMKQIHDGIVSAGISAWLFFGLFGGNQGDNGLSGPIAYGPGYAGYALTPFYYMWGGLSKFVRPGFKVIRATQWVDASLSVSAYQNPTNKQVVIVVINQSSGSRPATFISQGWTSPGVADSYTTSAQTFSQQQTGLVRSRRVSLSNTQIPAKSVVTFVTPAPASILWRNTTSGASTIWLMNSLTTPTAVSLVPQANDLQVQATGDFDGDGTSDVLWRSASAGQLAIWFVKHGAVPASVPLGSPGIDWQVQGTGDFDGDNKSDILWRNSSTGQNQIWLMDGGSIKSAVTLAGALTNDWYLAGIGDFDGDGKSDILWRNTNGQPVIWAMNGTSVIGSGMWLTIVPGNDWQVSGVADFNNDGKADILWRNSNGTLVTWLMNSYNIGNQPVAGVLAPDWTIQGLGDYNADGTSDIVLRNTNGTVKLWVMQNGVMSAEYVSTTTLGSDWQIKGTGSFDQ